MRRLALLLAYVLAIGIGAASTWPVLTKVSGYGVPAGVWQASTLAGSPDADLYTRARVALGGLLALHREETMYYLASTDSSGRPLRSRCSYRLHGQPPPARWWSITAYAGDMFLFANDERRYSLSGERAALDAQGRFAIVSAPQRPAGDVFWLPTPGDGGLVFTLRLYNPDVALATAPERLAAPLIEPIGDCR
jgi:hypothetical protein